MHDPLSELPGYALRRAANTMMTELAGRLDGIGMRLSGATVLLVVADRRDLTSSEIGRMLDIQRANMVPLLNRLEAADLIERQPLDRKSQAIVLTRAGREKLKQVRKVTGKFEKDLMAKVPEAHRDHLVPALNALWR